MVNDGAGKVSSSDGPLSPWWQIVQWILGGLGLSAAMPLVLWHLWRQSILLKERKRLFGKVVLITGASSGLGEALAHVFYRAGCKVILSARRSNELERVKMSLMATEVVSNLALIHSHIRDAGQLILIFTFTAWTSLSAGNCPTGFS